MEELGKFLIIFGIIFLICGVVFWILGKLPFIGKLPGDISIKGENFSFYAPLSSMLLISLFLSLLLNIISRLKK